MVAFVKFQSFNDTIGRKIHDFRAAGDTLRIYLSNTTPNVSTMTVKADLPEITAGAGYTAGGADTQNDWTFSGGVGSCTGVDVTWTASGGSIGPFRFVALYNDTPTSPADPLLGYWDYGSAISINDTESFTTDFSSSLFTIS